MRDAMVTCVRSVVSLLVKGDYETAEALTRGQRLSADDLRRAVTDYGMTLVLPPDYAFDELEFIQITNSNPPAFYVVCDLWTAEEGLSDLSLELELTEIVHDAYAPVILGLHTM